MKSRAWAVVVVAGAALWLCGWGQPGEPMRAEAAAQDGGPEAGADGAGGEARRLRVRLERARGKIDEAIARLDAGAPAREVGREVWRSMREDAGGVWGAGPDGPEERGGPGRGEEVVALSPEELRALILSRLPGLGARIEELGRTDPTQAGVFVERLGRRVHDVEVETADDPALRALKLAELQAGMEVFETMRSLRGAVERGERTREDVVAELAGALGRHFDARLAVTRHEVERLRERLARMEREVESMGERRAAEVERMTERMLADRPGDGPEERPRRGPGVRGERP